MVNPIVTVNVSVTQAPAPSLLQRTGAMISQGGTTKAAQSLTLLTQLSDLTNILAGSKAITSMTWSGSVVTVTTTSPHGWTNGDTIGVTIAGVTPSGYNGSFTATITGTSTFTYPLASNPGSVTVQGNVTDADVAELLAMGTTFFAQPTQQSVYVLELGAGSPDEGVTGLTTFLTANPATIYSFLVPREWDNDTNFITLARNNDTPSSKLYFFVTTTVANRAVYAGIKSVLALVEAPAIPVTEFSLAAVWAVTLGYNPTSTNRVPPLAFAYVYGVTAYPLAGNSTTLTQLATANVSYVTTGAEGGISNTIVKYGHTADGNPFNYWYSADWAQLNVDLNLSNEVINGSNSTLAPLYYNQQGINRLQNRAAQTFGQAITNGLALGQVVLTQLPAATFAANFAAGLYNGQLAINAEPFTVYTAENPSDYAIGKYGGLAAVYTPLRGFEAIFFNLNVTNFA